MRATAVLEGPPCFEDSNVRVPGDYGGFLAYTVYTYILDMDTQVEGETYLLPLYNLQDSF